MFFRKAFSALALMGLMTLSASSVPLYSQAFLDDLGYASQNDTSAVGGLGNFSTVFDNFTLLSDASVTDISWFGGFFDFTVPTPVSSWTIQFYADDVLTDGSETYTVPGAVLATESFVGLANATLLPGGSYSYSHTLATAVNLQAGVQYWVSIVADLPYDPGGQWVWSNGSGGDGRVVQELFGSTLPEQSPDAAFSLSGDLLVAAVPELDPGRSTLPLAFAGCILGVLAGRRRVLS